MKNFYTILLSFALIASISCIKSKKKSLKTSTTELPPQPAIIAIEIVDPNENSTSKNSKRTIESSLGYGYNNYEKPRYEVYKYSQHDIPPYKGDSTKLFNTQHLHHFNIQKSVQYSLPPVTEQLPKALKPGTTLFSSLDSHGQIGSLTPNLNHISGLDQSRNDPLPVVVLRIYPDQLKDSTIQANLPTNHPFAKAINSVNIQSLLLHYIKALQSNTHYVQPQIQSSTPSYNAYNQQSEQQYYRPTLYNNQEYNGLQVQEAPIKYHFKYETPSLPNKPISAPVVQKKPSVPQQQYYYVETTDAPSSAQINQYYQKPHYYEDQYPSEYYNQMQRYIPNNDQKLLTTENFPSDKHTRVIFRGNTNQNKMYAGKLNLNEIKETEPVKEVKTIKIQVPENIANVQVEESEKPYYNNYQDSNQYQDQQTNYEDMQDSDAKQQDYYNVAEDSNYNYQNVDYEQMNQYFEQKSSMPNYFYQNNYNNGNRVQHQRSNEDLAAAYEDAAFPATTESTKDKKIKKKRTL